MLIESVINISEGQNLPTVEAIAHLADEALIDVHTDAAHHRSVLTLAGELDSVETAAQAVITAAVQRLDLGLHKGVHPRLGVADVVPFAPLTGSVTEEVIALRNRVASWESTELSVPCFLYGTGRSLPEIRREAFRTLSPDVGPMSPHPTAGATALGARPLLVAYNVWISVSEGGECDSGGALAMAKEVASLVRSDSVRTLGLPIGTGAQVSCNLIDPSTVGVAALFDSIAHLVEVAGGAVERAELVGLLPSAALVGIPAHRWRELDVSEDRTIEARLTERGTPAAFSYRG